VTGIRTAIRNDWKPKNSPNTFGDPYAAPRPPVTPEANVGSSGASSTGVGRLTSGVGGVGSFSGHGGCAAVQSGGGHGEQREPWLKI
jgi:hypothetical protein